MSGGVGAAQGHVAGGCSHPSPHARSGDAIAISSYLGNGGVFDRALISFAEGYADQNKADYKALKGAVAAGRVEAHLGLVSMPSRISSSAFRE
jgi:hypothetical protein